jgi:hypothetical protein
MEGQYQSMDVCEYENSYNHNKYQVYTNPYKSIGSYGSVNNIINATVAGILVSNGYDEDFDGVPGMISCGNGKNGRKKGGNNNSNKGNTSVTKDGQQHINGSDPQKPLFFFFNVDGPNNSDDELDEEIDAPAPPPKKSKIIPCIGKLCDHTPGSTNIPTIPGKFTGTNPGFKITLQDLIDLGMSYHCQCQKEFNGVSLERVAKLVEPLTKFRTMIGMKKLKEDIVEQIVYFLQDLEPNPAEMLHTILEGPPGVGKTHIIDILADIYLNMGYLSKKIIKKVKRSDLVGAYLGHTAKATQKCIDEAMGGILVIDEAYALGNAEKRDSFSKECIDTINQNLTERAGKFICIIAGYRQELDQCFFAYNPGLRSRFRYTYTLGGYDADELREIFWLKVDNDKWGSHPDLNRADKSFFERNVKSFKFFGRDMETLLFHVKIAHSNRAFFETADLKGKITQTDIDNGFLRFKIHSHIKTEDDDDYFNSLPKSIQQMFV